MSDELTPDQEQQFNALYGSEPEFPETERERMARLEAERETYFVALWQLVKFINQEHLSTPPATTIERYIRNLQTERDTLAALVREMVNYEPAERDPNGYLCAFCGIVILHHAPDCLITRARQALAGMEES